MSERASERRMSALAVHRGGTHAAHVHAAHIHARARAYAPGGRVDLDKFARLVVAHVRALAFERVETGRAAQADVEKGGVGSLGGSRGRRAEALGGRGVTGEQKETMKSN